MLDIKKLFITLAILVFVQGCVLRSAKPALDEKYLNFKKSESIDLIIYVRTMAGRPSSEDQALINLAWIYGNQKVYTQIICHSVDKNLTVLLSPGMGYVDDHVEYSNGYYRIDLYLGEIDGKNLSPPEAAHRTGYFVSDIRREREILETDTRAFGVWYITYLSTLPKDKKWIHAKPMECFTVNREVDK